jgi:hypothetical protein
VFVVDTVPATDTDGAVAVTPAVNVVASVASFPSVSVPVFENVDAPPTVFVAPVRETL